MKLDIIVWPDPRLKQKSLPVHAIDKYLVENLVETMYAEHGVGLAAPQVGVLQRIIVVDVREASDTGTLVLVNPEIIRADGVALRREGCLSVPGEFEEVERADRIVVRFLDVHGVETALTAHGLLSQAIQHECDHLDGIMYVDKVSPLKRDRIRKRMRKYQEQIEWRQG